MKRPKAPQIKESAAEKQGRVQAQAQFSQSRSLARAFDGRANDAAFRDNGQVMRGAANSAVAQTTADAVANATTQDGRANAIIAGNAVRGRALTDASGQAKASRLANIGGVIDRAMGVSGGALQSTSALARGQEQASSIAAQSQMQRQADRMNALGSMVTAGVNFHDHRKTQKQLNTQRMNTSVDNLITSSGLFG